MWLSEDQFRWLEDRLAYWARRRKPVMVITHHPLPNTVSGSHNQLYSRDYLQADRLLAILGRHRDVFLFCGHTHWDLGLSDWYVRRVVPGTANLDGFSVINTGAVQTGYTDDGKGGEVSPCREPSTRGSRWRSSATASSSRRATSPPATG
ncbi:3',5'-cyclic adenosine monophosphate phosphodiesterase CpdA [Streptomyces tanashiensis]